MAELNPGMSHDEKITHAKELYCRGSRNYLVKSYSEAADELSQACSLYEELYGSLADELGMPYLLYAKSLISLSIEENKVLEVPDEEEEEYDDEDEDNGDRNDGKDIEESELNEKKNGEKPSTTAEVEAVVDSSVKNTKKLETIEESEVVDSTEGKIELAKEVKADDDKNAEVSSTNDNKVETNGINGGSSHSSKDQQPGPSNGNNEVDVADFESVAEDEDIDVATNLQVAWETLELASKIFSRQGTDAFPNLAEVKTELGNIEFENNQLDAAREDFEKALKIYKELTSTNYRRAMAEIYYKIGLTYLIQQTYTEGAEALRDACQLLDDEINEMKAAENPSERLKLNIQDLEETKQEIWEKVKEIEETRQQNVDEVRAALDSFITPVKPKDNGAGPSSSSSPSIVGSSSSSVKASDISHLIKRKKPDSTDSEADSAQSPAKRPA